MSHVTVDIATATEFASRAESAEPSNNTFSVGAFEGFNAGKDDADWIVNRQRDRYDATFRVRFQRRSLILSKVLIIDSN